jgi:hypothetical protein
VDAAGTAGGVAGRTVVVAAVVIVDVVTISVEVGCCSWLKGLMLERYRSGVRDLWYWGSVEVFSFGGVGGLLIFL